MLKEKISGALLVTVPLDINGRTAIELSPGMFLPFPLLPPLQINTMQYNTTQCNTIPTESEYVIERDKDKLKSVLDADFVRSGALNETFRRQPGEHRT